MVEGIELINATEEHKKVIGKICRDCNSQYQELFPDFLLNQADYLEKTLPKEYDFKIIRKGQKNLGFLCTTKLNPESTYLAMLYFYKEHQHKGYGTQTLKLLENNLTEKNINSLYLLAHKDAYWALNFYKKYGFRILFEREEDILGYKDGMMKSYYYKGTYLMKI